MAILISKMDKSISNDCNLMKKSKKKNLTPYFVQQI